MNQGIEPRNRIHPFDTPAKVIEAKVLTNSIHDIGHNNYFYPLPKHLSLPPKSSIKSYVAKRSTHKISRYKIAATQRLYTFHLAVENTFLLGYFQTLPRQAQLTPPKL